MLATAAEARLAANLIRVSFCNFILLRRHRAANAVSLKPTNSQVLQYHTPYQHGETKRSQSCRVDDLKHASPASSDIPLAALGAIIPPTALARIILSIHLAPMAMCEARCLCFDDRSTP